MYTHTRDLLPFGALQLRWVLVLASFSQHEARPPPKEEMDVVSKYSLRGLIPRIREFPRWVRRPAV